MFASPQETLDSLRRAGYITDIRTATTVFLAGRLNRPILLEGPAGAGKTELATSVSRASGMPFIRLQCYSGISDKDAIGSYNRALQELYVLLQTKGASPDWKQIRQEIIARSFFASGPLLDAIEAEQRSVLLIDEIDKIEHAFEALLLEILSAWQLSIPGMGTIQARTVPFVVMTSNEERRLGDPLRRRSFYLRIEHPTPQAEATIVARKSPSCSPATHRFIAGLAKSLRAYTLEKPPSISEMNDIAEALELLGLTEIGDEHKDIMMPLIAKTDGDRKRLLMKQQFENIIHLAKRYAAEMVEGSNEADQKVLAKGAGA